MFAYIMMSAYSNSLQFIRKTQNIKPDQPDHNFKYVYICHIFVLCMCCKDLEILGIIVTMPLHEDVLPNYE